MAIDEFGTLKGKPFIVSFLPKSTRRRSGRRGVRAGRSPAGLQLGEGRHVLSRDHQHVTCPSRASQCPSWGAALTQLHATRAAGAGQRGRPWEAVGGRGTPRKCLESSELTGHHRLTCVVSRLPFHSYLLSESPGASTLLTAHEIHTASRLIARVLQGTTSPGFDFCNFQISAWSL